MKFDVQQSATSPVLPFEIIALIIDIVGENEGTNLLKELALVSHCFHQICSKHLFSTIELHDADPDYHTSPKKGFVKLLRSRPGVVNYYIREFTYSMNHKDQSSPSSPIHRSFDNDDHLLSSIPQNNFSSQLPHNHQFTRFTF